jgi:hypothetical protein
VLEKMPETVHEAYCDLRIDESGIHDSPFHH